MAAIFGAKSTTDEVLAGTDLRGKRAFITGVSAGLGMETARALVSRGAQVVGTARDLDKAAAASQAAFDAARESGGSLDVVAMDLADLRSVRMVTKALLDDGRPFHLVIANAGVMATPFGHTKDGFELQFGTNFLGHFVMANELAPLMPDGARLVALSSNGHRMADVDLDDPNFERTPYDAWMSYGRSKTADALLATAFDARHKGRGVRATSVHPGGIFTELTRHMDPTEFMATFEAMHERHLAAGNPPFEGKTIPQGAATTVWAAVAADAEQIGGRYCEDCNVAVVLTDDQNASPLSPGVRRYALDTDHAQALWAKANEMVGTNY